MPEIRNIEPLQGESSACYFYVDGVPWMEVCFMADGSMEVYELNRSR